MERIINRDLPSRDNKTRQFRSSRTNFNKTSQVFNENEQGYNINFINLTVDEQQFLSNTKIELMQIQEQINEMDVDQKIRFNQPNDLEKQTMKEIKKHLNKYSHINGNQLLESRLKQDFNEQEFIQFLNVSDSQEAIKKLYRILQISDILIQKLTEQQLVFLVKYDQMFEDICGSQNKMKKNLNSKFNQLGQGIQINKFHSFMANLERFQDLFAYSAKLININEKSDNNFITQSKSSVINSSSKIRQIQTVEELYAALDSDLFDLDKIQCAKIQEILNKVTDHQILQTQKIDKQNHEILILNEKVNKLKKQIEDQDYTLNTTRSGFYQQNQQTDADYYIKIVQEVEDQFKSQLELLSTENQKLSLQNEEYKQLKENLQNQIIQIQDDYQTQLQAKENLIKQIQSKYDNSNQFEDKFEDALRESFELIKIGFEQKLAQKEQELQQIQRKRNIDVYDLKQDIKRESETKRLLMKKLSLFIKI